jgi:hypothetical protein
MSNLFVSYELLVPSQNERAVQTTLKTCGQCIRVRHSMWYVKSLYRASDVADKLRTVMDVYDNVIVIDTSNDNAAWYNIDATVADALLKQWKSR